MQVAISQEASLRVQMYARTKVIVMPHLTFLQPINRFINEQYTLRNLPIPFVTSIRSSIQLSINQYNQQLIQISFPLINTIISRQSSQQMSSTKQIFFHHKLISIDFTTYVSIKLVLIDQKIKEQILNIIDVAYQYLQQQMQIKMKEFNTPPPNYKLNERATHGLSHPLSVAQVASYIAIASSVAIYFSSVVTLHSIEVLLALYIIFGITMLVSSSLATFNDPTDRLVYFYKWSRFDPSIEFTPQYQKILFCNYCESYCLSNSKHCKTCNRCTSNFDHHCMWFNNCVGQSNYKYFFISIISTFGYAFVIIIQVILASFTINFNVTSQLIRIVFCWIIGLALVVFDFLLLNLILLHIYLNATNQTTYEYIQRKKKQQQIELKQKQRDENIRQKALKEASSNQTLPIKVQNEIPKHVDIYSQDSYANTKVIVIHDSKSPKINNPHLQRNNNMLEGHFQSNQEVQNKLYDQQTIANRNPQNAHSQLNDEDKNKKKLPTFLRNNKSLKFLLSSSQAEVPHKKKLQPNSSQRHIK